MNNSTGAIILAGGKGKRMNLEQGNKVALFLSEKPIITHIVHFMKKLGMEHIVVVVGHEKESVMDLLKDEKVIFAQQKEQLGTGHALSCGLSALPEFISDVLVVYGDDAVLYSESQAPIIHNLFSLHEKSSAPMTFLTIELENPYGLGRIVRDEHGNVTSIVEEKDATLEERTIKEINPGCFLFSVTFLKKYLPRLEKSPVTGEYYLTSLIDLAIGHKEKIETVRAGKINWRGINTPEEFEQAQRFFAK